MFNLLIRQQTRFNLAALVLLTALATQPRATAQETQPPTQWTDIKANVLEADFVRMTDEAVVLKRKKDGVEVTVPLAMLSIESHYQAVRAANPAAFSKPVPKAEVKPEITVELPQLDLNVAEMLKSPFAANTSIDQFFQIIKREHAAGNFFVWWHAAPPKIQSDTEEVIIKAAETLGPATFRQLQTLFRDVHTIVQDKREFILAHPLVASQAEVVAQLEALWPLLAGLTGVLAQEDHWQLANFQPGKVAPWMAQLNVSLAPYVIALQQTAKELLPPGANSLDSIQYNILSNSADSAEVEVVFGSLPPEKSSYKKVGNIWIDAQVMNDTRKSLDNAKEKLAGGAAAEVGMIRTTLAGVIAAVGGLARANSQAEFNDALSLLQDIGRNLSQTVQAGLTPPGPGQSGNQPPRRQRGS